MPFTMPTPIMLIISKLLFRGSCHLSQNEKLFQMQEGFLRKVYLECVGFSAPERIKKALPMAELTR